jgi:hypothetical protein
MMSGVLQATIDIGLFQIRKMLQDLFRPHSSSKQFEHLTDGNSHPANSGLTATKVGYDCDPMEVYGGGIL